MELALKYLADTFGKEIQVQPVNKQFIGKLPYYITHAYRLWTAELFQQKVCFAEEQGEEHFTPAQYKRQMDVIQTSLGIPTILILPGIEAYNRNRLMQQGINLIFENKQMFLPGFLTFLNDNLKPAVSPIKNLQPMAQCLLLFHLQKQKLDGFTFKQIADLLQYPYLTINRAIDNLKNLGLCILEGNKTKTIRFASDGRELWEQALPLLTNPVKKAGYINEPIPKEMLAKTNINALAHYTRINDEARTYKAIAIDIFRELHKAGKIGIQSDYDGDFFIEQWKYDPRILATDGFIDRLSLYLIFKDDPDDRIQIELEQMMKGIKW